MTYVCVELCICNSLTKNTQKERTVEEDLIHLNIVVYNVGSSAGKAQHFVLADDSPFEGNT